MSASAAAILAGAAMAMPGAAQDGATVDIVGRAYSPASLQVLVGQTVTWRNRDHGAHVVNSTRGGPLASGRMLAGATYEHTFEERGTFRYYCTLHRTMQGSVTVSALGLTGPAAPVRAGARAMLSALVPAGVESVTLEREGAAVATAVPDAQGRATFHVTADTPGSYQARAGELTSAPVRVRVAPVVTVTAARAGARVRVQATIAPAQPGATVALERYVRERFDYRPVATTRTTDGTSATFTLKAPRRVALKVAVVKPAKGWAVGRSGLITVSRQGVRGTSEEGPGHSGH